MNNFAQRTLTGIVFVAVLSFCTLFHQYTFIGIFALITLLSLIEFYRLVLPPKAAFQKALASIIGVLIYSIVSLIAYGFLHVTYLFLMVPFVLMPGLFELFFSAEKPFQNISAQLAGWLYIVLPFTLLHWLAVNQFDEVELIIPFSIFLMIWINDTGAYLVGRSIGKTPLFKRISPKKTIEGTLGGLLLVLLISAFFSNYISDSLSQSEWMILGALVSVGSTMGDLIESQLKRSLHIKDSGSILPGHGGMLDRFDAMLFAVPIAFFYIKIIQL